MAAPRQQFGFDEVTLGKGDITASLKCDGVASATCSLLQDQAAAPANRSPEQALLHAVENADDLRLIARAADPAQTRQNLLPDRGRGRRACLGKP